MLLNILIVITGIFLLIFLESFLISFVGFNIVVVAFFATFRKYDWKTIAAIFGSMFLILDVVSKYTLGTNILIIGLLFAIMVMLSLFLPVRENFVGFFVNTLLISLFYILQALVPPFLIVGSWGSISFSGILLSLFKGVLSALVILLFEYVFDRFRNRGNTSQIRLK